MYKVLRFLILKTPHMGHRDQDGKKVDEMSLFFFKVRSWYGQIKAKFDFYLILAWKIVPNKISSFRRNLRCAP